MSINPDGEQVRVKYDPLHLHGKPKMESKQVDVKKSDGLSKAPPETDIKAGEIVRVVQEADHLGEGVLKWQYGKVYWVHSKLLLDIEYEGGEKSKGLPAYAHEVRRA